MYLSDYTVAINRFRELLDFVVKLSDRKSALEYLTKSDCKNLNIANDELVIALEILNQSSSRSKEKKPDNKNPASHVA